MVTSSLPLLTLYLTERCNSRCVSCDYWRHEGQDMSLASIERWLPGLAALGTRVVLISGGEPLLHPQWAEIAQLLRSRGLRLWLLTSGLALARHAPRLAELFESLTVSLDGTTARTYQAVRGLDAFDVVCAGIRAAARAGRAPMLRVTVQRANFRELPRFVELARELGAAGVSFLAADVGNPHAFGRDAAEGFDAGNVALRADEAAELESLIEAMEQSQAEAFRDGYIQESPAKLRRIAAHYRALAGQQAFAPVRCNAPEFSAVIEASGRLRPCFFIPGPGAGAGEDLQRALDEPLMKAQRADIRAGRRGECERCVCAMWREPEAVL